MIIAIVFVIFDHPLDHPGHFVLRRQFVKSDPADIVPAELAPRGTSKTDDPYVDCDNRMVLASDIAELRALLPRDPNLTCMGDPNPFIAEVWYALPF